MFLALLDFVAFCLLLGLILTIGDLIEFIGKYPILFMIPLALLAALWLI